MRVEMREPSMRNWTLVTPTLSEAVAERVTVEEMVPEGEVRVIVGRVVSRVMGREQDAVVPPFDPLQDQRELVVVSVVSEKVPVVQVLIVVEHEPLMGVVVWVPVYSYAPMSHVPSAPRVFPSLSLLRKPSAVKATPLFKMEAEAGR